MKSIPVNFSKQLSSLPKLITALAITFCMAHSAWGQNIASDTITWTITSAVSQADQNSFAYSCSIKTFGSNAADWIQSGGGNVSHFAVSSVDGSWTDISQGGSATFNVSYGTVSGTMEFSSSGGQSTIHLQLAVNGNPDQNYVFNVSSTGLSH